MALRREGRRAGRPRRVRRRRRRDVEHRRAGCHTVMRALALTAAFGAIGCGKILGYDPPYEEAPECPSDRGPKMVRVGEFCIDTTEVTYDDYNAFYVAIDASGKLPEMLDACSTINQTVHELAPP